MKKLKILVILFTLIYLQSCGDSDTKTEHKIDMNDKGIGPIKTLVLGDIDDDMVKIGSEIFNSKCIICHKIETKSIGPEMKGVTKKRSPEWIMNMIMNPQQMIKENEIAKQLLKEYRSPMTNQNISQEEARALLEYLRSIDE